MTDYIDVTHIELEEGVNGSSSGSRSRSFGDGGYQVPINAEMAAAAVHTALCMDDENFDGVKHHPETRLSNLMAAMTSVVGIMASLAAFFSLLAMFVDAGSVIVYLCFGLTGLVVAPAVVVQRTRLQWEPTFREVSNDLRMKVNDFAMANSTLQSEVSRLERQIIRLSAVEERFNQIVGREQIGIDRARTLVRENGYVQKEIKRLQAASEMQAIIEAIMLADKDSNSFISEKELDEMMIRLRVFASPSSSISEDEIRSAFKKAMTSQGASLGRIHSHLLAQEEAASEDDEIATQLV